VPNIPVRRLRRAAHPLEITGPGGALSHNFLGRIAAAISGESGPAENTGPFPVHSA
jgi:hypothetical protein